VTLLVTNLEFKISNQIPEDLIIYIM